MIWLRQAVLFLHLLAAAFWVGEILFVALVLGPLARSLPPQARSALLRESGRRTLPWVWTAIGVLIATGIGNLYFLGLGPSELLRSALYRTTFGWLLLAKLVAALGMFAHAAVHDFVYGRRARRLRAAADQASGERRRQLEAEYAHTRRAAAAVGRANLVLALIVLALAAGLGVRS